MVELFSSKTAVGTILTSLVAVLSMDAVLRGDTFILFKSLAISMIVPELVS